MIAFMYMIQIIFNENNMIYYIHKVILIEILLKIEILKKFVIYYFERKILVHSYKDWRDLKELMLLLYQLVFY
jgi:hypothetical protein